MRYLPKIVGGYPECNIIIFKKITYLIFIFFLKWRYINYFLCVYFQFEGGQMLKYDIIGKMSFGFRQPKFLNLMIKFSNYTNLRKATLFLLSFLHR